MRERTNEGKRQRKKNRKTHKSAPTDGAIIVISLYLDVGCTASKFETIFGQRRPSKITTYIRLKWVCNCFSLLAVFTATEIGTTHSMKNVSSHRMTFKRADYKSALASTGTKLNYFHTFRGGHRQIFSSKLRASCFKYWVVRKDKSFAAYKLTIWFICNDDTHPVP